MPHTSQHHKRCFLRQKCFGLLLRCHPILLRLSHPDPNPLRSQPQTPSGSHAPGFDTRFCAPAYTGTIRIPENRSAFARGTTFLTTYPDLPYLGELLQLRLGTSGQGMFASWNVRMVELTHLASGSKTLFACHGWIDKQSQWTRVLMASPG